MLYRIAVVLRAVLDQFHIVLLFPLQMADFLLILRHLPIGILFLLPDDLQPFRQGIKKAMDLF